MSYAKSAGAIVRHHAYVLVGLARSTGSTEYEVVEFVRTLLAYLIRADGSSGAAELIVQQAFNDDSGFSLMDEAEYTLDRIRHEPDFLATRPAMFARAAHHDRTHGGDSEETMILCVANICDVIAGVDGSVHSAEAGVRETIIALLRTPSSAS